MYSKIKTAARGVIPPEWFARLKAIVNWLTGDPEIRLLSLVCDHNRTSVDVGAHTGTYTYFLWKHSARVLCVEPNPQIADLLRRSFPSRVCVCTCALSDSNGEVVLTIPLVQNKEKPGLATIEPDNPLKESEAARKITVPVRRLDDFDTGPVGFIKIDVEGHELAVLKGAASILDRDAPTVLVESENRHKPGAVEAILDFFGRRGYQGFFYLEGRLVAIANFDPARHQDPTHIRPDGRRLGKVYVNNFFFVKDVSVFKRLEEARLFKSRG